jgi:hypothetical protein
LHLHHHVPSPRWRKWEVRSRRRVGAFLTLYALVKLLDQGWPTIGRRIPLVLVLKFGPDIVSQIELHRHRPKLELGTRVENVAIRHSCEHAGDSLLRIHFVQVEVLSATVDGLKAVRFDGAPRARLNAAVGLEDVGNCRPAFVRLALEEMEQIARKRLVQWDAVLVLPVKSRSLVLPDVLGQRDCGQQRQGIVVNRIKLRPQRIQQVLRIIGVALADELQVGVNKNRPEELPKLKLDSFVSAAR